MAADPAADAFETELRGLIEKYRHDWDLSYAEAIGTLELVQGRLVADIRPHRPLTHPPPNVSDSPDTN